MHRHATAIAVIALAGFAATAAAQRVARVTFAGVSRIDEDNLDTGERQLKMDVTALGPARMQRGGEEIFADALAFTFSNDGVTTSAVTGIYFDENRFLSLFGIFDNMLENGPGTLFEQPATPGEFPDADQLVPAFTTDFSLGAFGEDLETRLANGIAPGEFVTITLGLLNGVSASDIVDRILSGQFRVSLLVQGFADGGIETFVNNPVPAPATATMLAVAGFAAARRRRA